MVVAKVSFYLYPYPMANLVVTRQYGSSITNITPTSDSSNRYWVSGSEGTYTFSADNFITTVVEQTEYNCQNVTLKPSHLYKWTNSSKNISYYTNTPTPTTNSFIYNATGDNVTNTYIYGGDTQAYFSSSNNTTMVYNIVWGSPAANYSAVLPIGGTYTAAGGINPKEK